jgi:hypothetical protein
MNKRRTKVQHPDLKTWGADENAEKVGPHLFKLRAGALIHIPQSEGRCQVAVKASCGENNGFWYCASCEKLFHNNFLSHVEHFLRVTEKDGHICEPTKDHFLVWMCAQHGAEQP